MLEEAAGSNRWGGMMRIVKDENGDAAAIQLRARGAERFVTMQTQLQPKVPADYYLVTLEVRMRDFAGQARFWPQAGVIIQSRDRYGKWLWYWPFKVFGLNGEHDWRALDGLIPIAAAATSTTAFTYVLADQGTAEFRKIRIRLARERLPYKLIYYGLLIAWVAFAAFGARAALRARGRNLGRLVCVVIAGVMVFGGTVPQPGLKEALRSISFSTQDLLHAAHFLIKDLTTSPTSGTKTPTPTSPKGTTSEPSAQDEDAEEGSMSSASAPSEAANNTTRSQSQKMSRPPVNYWEPQINYLDKLMHLAAFAFFAFIVQLSWRQTSPLRTAYAVVCVSAGIQLVQLLMVTRDGNLDDFSADLTGVVLGTAIGALITRRAWRRLKTP